MTPPPGSVIADHTQLDGFTEIHGLRISPIGDDGTNFVVIGHHNDGHVAEVMHEFLEHHMNWTRGALDDVPPDDVKAALEQTWAVFTSEDAGSNWWCDTSATQDTPNAVAVTTCDLS